MSTQRKAEFAVDGPSEEMVREYLADHPKFFERHADLLGSLSLPHGGGGAVSLVERQVAMLRQKDLKHERKLKELLAVARDNDALVLRLHRLALALLRAGDRNATLARIEKALRVEFDADQSVLVLYDDGQPMSGIRAGRFLRMVAREEPALKAFDTFLSGSGPRCGQVRDSQRDFLFGKDTDEVGSVALVPLGDQAGLGFLAIGSVDAERFNPGMSIDFLKRLGELIAEALKRF